MSNWGRREKVLALVVVLSLIVAIPGTGAFSSVTAERTATVSVANDADAFLGLTPHSSANGQYAETTDGQLELRIDETNPDVTGDGVNQNAITTFDDVFNVTNQGTQRVAVSVNDSARETNYYVIHEGERLALDEVEVVLDPGDVAEVGLVTNTTGEPNVVVPNDIEIVAEATDTDSPFIGDPEDDRPGVILPDGDSAVQAGVDTMRIGTDLSPNGSTTVSATQTQASAYTGIALESLQFPQDDPDTVALSIEQREGPPANVPPLDTTNTLVTHFVATPDTPATANQAVTFQFRVNESVAGDPSELTVYRYSDGWSTLDTTVEESPNGYILTASSPGFSTFAVGSSTELFTEAPTGPPVIDSVNTTNEIDRTDDGYLSAFDLKTELDLSDAETDSAPVVSVWINETNAGTYTIADDFNGTMPLIVDWEALAELDRGTYDVRVDIRAGPDPTAERLDSETITLRLDPVAGATDPSALNFQSEADDLYRGYSEDLYSSAYRRAVAERAADRAAAILNERLEGMLNPSLRDLVIDVALKVIPGGQIVDSGLNAAETAQDVIDATIVAGNVGITIQQESTAVYLDATRSETTALRENLDALVQNSEDLAVARETGNEELESELLVERRQLLRETYALIPVHIDAVHEEVIDQSVGAEDRNTYVELRSHGELLRQTILSDYALTTEELTGSPESLAGTQTMPTQGWERADRSVVYDTIAYPSDYTVYRVDVTETQANETARLRLQGNNVDSMVAFVSEDQPFDPENATGEPLSDVQLEQFRTLQPTRQYDIEEPGEYYVVVRGGNAIGQYRLIGSTTTPTGRFGEAISVEPITRSDPPALRPEVELVESPEPFELEETDRTVYAASESNVSLVWDLWDAETPASELEYRYRVDRGEGFTELSSWQSPTDNGTLELGLDLDEGVNRVQIVVRNDQYMQTVDSVDVVVSTFEPQAYLATDDDVTSNAVFVKVIPDRRISGIELQYRESGADEWRQWQNVTETTGLGRLEFPQTGYFEVRTRAISPSGIVGEWASTNLVYTGPPRVTLESAPAAVKTSDTAPVRYERVTDANATTVAWNVSSELTATDELAYRTRITSADGSGTWSSWQSAPASGTIERTAALEAGSHTFDIEVRDEQGRVSNDSVDVVVDRTEPTVTLTTAPDVERGQFNVSLDQRVRTLEFEYAPADDPENWQSLTTQSFVNTGSIATSASLAPGQYLVRVRATDYTGATSQWTTDTVRSLDANDTAEEPIDDTVRGDDKDDTTTVTVPEIGGSNRVDVELISGDMIVDAYLITREGRSEYLTSISLSAQRNQTLVVDAPGELVADAQGMELVVRGEGEVYLDSLRAFETDGPEPTVVTDPQTVSATNPAELSIDTDPYVEGSIDNVTWDLTDNGTVDATGVSITHVYETAGNQTGTVTVTNVFGDQYTDTFTLSVNAAPDPTISSLDTALTGQPVTFNGSRTADPDGEIVSYEWRIDEDVVATGSDTTTHTTRFNESGAYNVSVTATDDEGASTTVTEPVRIVGPMNFSRVDNRTCTGFCEVETDTTLLVGGTPNAETITVTQDGTEYRVSPLQNGQAIDTFYDYGNAKINSPLPIAESDRSRLFFWDGPEGLSLVVLHDEGNDGSGGAVSFDFERLPREGSWVVKDDSGDFTSRTQADWTWNYQKTDGGAFRGGLYDQRVRITPRFNGAARQRPLSPGKITRWELLTGQATDPDTKRLALDKPVTLTVPPEAGDADTSEGNGTGTATWEYSREEEAAVTFDLVYETEQLGDNPDVEFTITDSAGTTETRELTIGTAGTERVRLDMTQFEGDVTMTAETEDTALRMRLDPVLLKNAE